VLNNENNGGKPVKKLIFLLSLNFHQSIILLIWSTRSGIKKDYQC